MPILFVLIWHSQQKSYGPSWLSSRSCHPNGTHNWPSELSFHFRNRGPGKNLKFDRFNNIKWKKRLNICAKEPRNWQLKTFILCKLLNSTSSKPSEKLWRLGSSNIFHREIYNKVSNCGGLSSLDVFSVMILMRPTGKYRDTKIMRSFIFWIKFRTLLNVMLWKHTPWFDFKESP